MDNRFGLKEVVLSVLMTAIIIVLLLAMVQNGRQWDELMKINSALDEQAKDLEQTNKRSKELGQIRVLIGQQSNALRSMAERLEQAIRAIPATRAHDVTTPPVIPVDPVAQVEPVEPITAVTQIAPGIAPEPSNEVDPFERRRAAAAMPGYASGDWFVAAFGVAVAKLTPLVSSDVYGSIVQEQVIESLATRDPVTLEWKPLIARSWDISKDGLTIVMRLRKNVRFSDGVGLTADDVVFSYNWIMNPKVAAPRARAYYDKVDSVVEVGDYTVIFKLKEPYFKGFDICATIPILAQHYYEQFTEEEFNSLPGLLFGTGPYKLSVDPKLWKPGTGKIELVRNDRYWGVPPAYDQIVYREIVNETARLTTFRNGDTDRFGPTPEQYVKLKTDEQLKRDKDLYEYETVVGGYRYVAWNQLHDGKPTRFADKRVRQAMTMLTDRTRMCRTLMVGLATPNSGPFHRLGKQANPDIEPWPYEPKRARELLKQAGFEDRDGDGVIEGRDGVPFKFKLIYPSSSVNYKQMAFFLKDAYARAGIVLEPDPLEWTIMVQRMDQRKFDAMTLGWSGSVEGDPNQIFHSNSIGDGGDNYVHYSNAELDTLIDQARVMMDEEKRMALWHKVHAILHEDQPYTFLWTRRAVVFVDKRIRNVQRVKLGLNDLTEWFVPLAQQKY
jgi:peptide/nickel transport system substrate-binding protein